MTEAALAARDVASRELEEWKKKGANLLLPSTHIDGLSEFHKPVLEVVQLSSNPEGGDVYAHDNAAMGPKKKWRLTKQALMKLSVCAGVIWSVDQTRRIDNGLERNYIAYKAVGGIKKPDGQPVFFSAEYDMDFEVLEEELADLYGKKIENGLKSKQGGEAGWATAMSPERRQKWIDDCVKRDLLQKRKHRRKLCEAGAMNRVLRMLLGIKQAYTQEELSKPFVVMRVVYQPDYNDKAVKAAFLDASLKAQFGIYGTSALPAIPEKTTEEPIDVTPIPEDDGDDDGAGEGNVVDPALSAGAPATFDDPTIDFKNSDEFGQCRAITDLANRTGYALADYLNRAKKQTLASVTPAKRLELFQYLLSIPKSNVTAPAPAERLPDDDIPF